VYKAEVKAVIARFRRLVVANSLYKTDSYKLIKNKNKKVSLQQLLSEVSTDCDFYDATGRVTRRHNISPFRYK